VTVRVKSWFTPVIVFAVFVAILCILYVLIEAL
jgi:hypothetical protein